MVLVIILLGIFVCIIGRFIASYLIHIDTSGIELEFSEFTKMYSAAPDKYDLGQCYVTYELYDDYDDDDDWCDDYDDIHIYFSFLDYIQYRIWFNKIQKQEKAERAAKKAKECTERQKEFLDSVAKDMKQNMEE